MAGNSRRPGAVRKTARKGPSVGTGGHRRRGLEGKGPTPKAEDRVHHKAHRAASRSTSAAAKNTATGSGASRRSRGSSELIFGRNSVVEALLADVPVTTMYAATRIEVDDRVRTALRLAQERGIPILESARGELDRLTAGGVHQGLAASIPPYDYADPRDLIGPSAAGSPLLVALDGVTDPRNLGAVIRAVAAFGGQGVIVPERRSVGVTAGTWKASAGAAARVPVAKAGNLTRALEDYRRSGYFVVGLDAEASVDLPEMDLAFEPLVLVIGSEGKGLSRLVRETCDQVVSIPMASGMESLNAGVAAGIALYEVTRRRSAGESA